MNSPAEVVAFYRQRIESTNHPVEKKIIENDLFLYYYRLADSEKETIRQQMKPFLDAKRADMEKVDPVLKRAGDLLDHLQKSEPIS